MAVLVVLGIIFQLVGLSSVHTAYGTLNYKVILIIAAVFGMGGSFISLAVSKWIAKITLGVQLIDIPANSEEQQLLEIVRQLANQAGIGMPEVGVYMSDEMNAFATGPHRDHALVAVSSGLIRRMDSKEVEAVLGHEITHVANGDMVTLALIQGVLNTFVIFLARVLGGWVDSAITGDGDRPSGIGYFFTVVVLEIIFGILASMIVMAFSRWREFRADAGGAKLAGRNAMISALKRLRQSYDPTQAGLPGELKAFGISNGGGFSRLFMSHPPLDQRIAALEQMSGD